MNNNFDREKLINTIISSSGGKLSESDLKNAAAGKTDSLMANLNQEDRKKLSEALSDPNKAKQLLSSKAAKQLLSELFGKGNG